MRPDKAGAAAPRPFSKKETPDSAKVADHETFFKTLQDVSRDRNRSQGSDRQASRSADRMEDTEPCRIDTRRRDNESVGDETPNDTPSLVNNDEIDSHDETQATANREQLIAWLEELGLKISFGEEISLPATPLAPDHMANQAETVLDSLTDLKQLLRDIDSFELRPDKEMAAGLERLRQLVARAMGADLSGQDQNTIKEGLNPAQKNATGINGVVGGEGAGSQKLEAILSALARITAGADNGPNAPQAGKPPENANAVFSTEDAAKADAAKLNPNIRTGAEADAAVRDVKAGPAVSDKGLINFDEAGLTGKTGDSKSNEELSRLLSRAEKGIRPGGESQMESSLTGEPSPVSKLINDAQTAKENPLKTELFAADDAGSKVLKLEAGTSDSGQLASQWHATEKTSETASLTKDADAASRELRTHTLEQIVRRAVIQVRDGQHEARIDLKPDFLGHVRMQVITANQQVTVKILTEFGFVKDMIENSIQQLKTDLQQQGLEVDKVDVSVSRDAQGNKHPQENFGHTGNRKPGPEPNDRGNEWEGQPERPKRSVLRSEDHGTVDYFA